MQFLASIFILFSSIVFAQGLTAPNTSANALFLYQNSNFHQQNQDPAHVDQTPNGINLQEAELQFYADVDPYTRLSLLFSIHPTYETDGTTVEEKWGFEPEEAFAETNVVPLVTFKVGKFKAFMGKHNTLHSHAYPFIQAPLANELLLGDEGLNDVGASAAILLPTSWYNELTLQYLKGEGENAEFHSPTPDDGVGLVHWKNLWDLSDALTMEAGLSYAKGGNDLKKETTLSGADLTFKWRPSDGGRYKSFMWATEYLSRTQEQVGETNEYGYGLATWVQYQFAERWATLYRFDNLNVSNSYNTQDLPNKTWERHSVALVYMPSEFSSFKLEIDRRHGGTVNNKGQDTENAVFLQANFTIGSHPAHSY
jgi:hypothetical protein